jgi:hypothetical protein
MLFTPKRLAAEFAGRTTIDEELARLKAAFAEVDDPHIYVEQIAHISQSLSFRRQRRDMILDLADEMDREAIEAEQAIDGFPFRYVLMQDGSWMPVKDAELDWWERVTKAEGERDRWRKEAAKWEQVNSENVNSLTTAILKMTEERDAASARAGAAEADATMWQKVCSENVAARRQIETRLGTNLRYTTAAREKAEAECREWQKRAETSEEIIESLRRIIAGEEE